MAPERRLPLADRRILIPAAAAAAQIRFLIKTTAVLEEEVAALLIVLRFLWQAQPTQAGAAAVARALGVLLGVSPALLVALVWSLSVIQTHTLRLPLRQDRQL